MQQYNKYGGNSRQYKVAARRYGRAAVRNDTAARTYLRHTRSAVKQYRQDRGQLKAAAKWAGAFTGRDYKVARSKGLRQFAKGYKSHYARLKQVRRYEAKAPTYRKFNQAGRKLVQASHKYGVNSRQAKAASQTYARAAVRNDAAARKR